MKKPRIGQENDAGAECLYFARQEAYPSTRPNAMALIFVLTGPGQGGFQVPARALQTP